MRFYVAGKWEDRLRVREVMKQIRKLGHTVVYDWTRREGETHTILQECAIADRWGVCRAQVLLIVALDDYAYSGTVCELGIAIGRDTPVWIVGHGIDNCIFTHLPEVTKWETLDDVYQKLGESDA